MNARALSPVSYAKKAVAFGRSPQGGLTLSELLITLAIIAVVVLFSLPIIGRVSERSLEAKCVQNMRQLGSAFHAYVADKNGTFPKQIQNLEPITSSASWAGQLFPYAGSYLIMSCPLKKATERNPASTYLYNGYIALYKNPRGFDAVRVTQSKEPSKDVIMVDHYGTRGWSHAEGTPHSELPQWFPHPLERDPVKKLRSRRSVLFVDGHVEVHPMDGPEILLKHYRWLL